MKVGILCSAVSVFAADPAGLTSTAASTGLAEASLHAVIALQDSLNLRRRVGGPISDDDSFSPPLDDSSPESVETVINQFCRTAALFPQSALSTLAVADSTGSSSEYMTEFMRLSENFFSSSSSREEEMNVESIIRRVQMLDATPTTPSLRQPFSIIPWSHEYLILPSVSSRFAVFGPPSGASNETSSFFEPCEILGFSSSSIFWSLRSTVSLDEASGRYYAQVRTNDDRWLSIVDNVGGVGGHIISQISSPDLTRVLFATYIVTTTTTTAPLTAAHTGHDSAVSTPTRRLGHIVPVHTPPRTEESEYATTSNLLGYADVLDNGGNPIGGDKFPSSLVSSATVEDHSVIQHIPEDDGRPTKTPGR